MLMLSQVVLGLGLVTTEGKLRVIHQLLDRMVPWQIMESLAARNETVLNK